MSTPRTRRVYPARYLGRPGPHGTGEFYTGVRPGDLGEAERITYPAGPPQLAFHRPGGAWLAVYHAGEIQAAPSALARWQVFAAVAAAFARAAQRYAGDELAGNVRCRTCGHLGDPVYAGHGQGSHPYATGEFTCHRCRVQLVPPRDPAELADETLRWYQAERAFAGDAPLAGLCYSALHGDRLARRRAAALIATGQDLPPDLW